MSKRKTMILLLAVLATIAAFAWAADEDSAQGVAAGRERMRAALHARDADALAACYTRDARLYWPTRPPVDTPEAVLAQSRYALEVNLADFRLEVDDFISGEDIAVEIGRCTFINTLGQEFDGGRYMTVWKKEDGVWKIHRDFVS